MNELKLFLERHAMVHAPEIGGAAFTMQRVVVGLDATKAGAPRAGMNPIAWILWHMARVEDSCIAGTVIGKAPLLDDAWTARLGVADRTDGEGMTREAATALGGTVDWNALLAYRDAVGVRTRELVADLAPDLWHQALTEGEIEDRVQRGVIPADEVPVLKSFTRSSMLWWWAIEHTHYHLGQIALLRS